MHRHTHARARARTHQHTYPRVRSHARARFEGNAQPTWGGGNAMRRELVPVLPLIGNVSGGWLSRRWRSNQLVAAGQPAQLGACRRWARRSNGPLHGRPVPCWCASTARAAFAHGRAHTPGCGRLALLPPAGEAYDYMGSRRLLYEMSRNSTFTLGLDLGRIDQVRGRCVQRLVSGGRGQASRRRLLLLHGRAGFTSGAALPCCLGRAAWLHKQGGCPVSAALAATRVWQQPCPHALARPPATLNARQVLEVGPIGENVNMTTNASVLYMHSQPGAAFGSAAAISTAITAAATATNSTVSRAQACVALAGVAGACTTHAPAAPAPWC
jgi:hypothetical protein